MSEAAHSEDVSYQCPMHPWIHADEPARCSICGMDLVAAASKNQEGAPGSQTNLVMLPEGAPQASSIRTAEVRRETLVRTLRFGGTIEDNDARHRVLSAYTGGRLEKLVVNFEGAEVEAGQPLALFYSPALLTAAREYTLARKQNNAAIATVAASRLQQMGLTPEQIAKVPARAPDDLFFEILAPISGTVVKRAAYEGQYVEVGEKLMEIADFSTMWLQFPAYEQDLPFLKVGQKVEMTLPSLAGKTLSANISFINPNLNDETRSAMVRVEITNPKTPEGKLQKYELLHLTYAEVRIAVEKPDVLAVPRSAVLWSGKQPRLYVEKSPNNYEQRIVSLGQSGDETWEVLNGLEEGERVIVSGNMLVDGQAQITALGVPPAPVVEDAIRTYLTRVAALGDALAADDLPKYRTALETIPAAPAGFPEKPANAGHDLLSARRGFQPFSQAVVAAAQKIRAGIPELKVFGCPMSEQAGEGFPKGARWVQLSSDIRNPYFGAEMLECGAEIPAP